MYTFSMNKSIILWQILKPLSHFQKRCLKKLLEKINAAYADFPNEEEQALHKSMRH